MNAQSYQKLLSLLNDVAADGGRLGILAHSLLSEIQQEMGPFRVYYFDGAQWGLTNLGIFEGAGALKEAELAGRQWAAGFARARNVHPPQTKVFIDR